MAATTQSKAGAAAKDASLTDEVAAFIVQTRGGDIPKDVAHLGKRSVLDGIGLALAGAASQTGEIARKYLRALGCEYAQGYFFSRPLAATTILEYLEQQGPVAH